MAGIRQLATSLSDPLGRLLMLSDTALGGEKKGKGDQSQPEAL